MHTFKKASANIPFLSAILTCDTSCEYVIALTKEPYPRKNGKIIDTKLKSYIPSHPTVRS